MNNPQQSYPSSSFQQSQPKNKTLLIVLSAVIGVLVLLGSCAVYVAYNSQKAAEEARVAKERVEEEKRAWQRNKEEAEAKRLAEEEAARLRAEEEARQRAMEEARLKAEEEARRTAEEERLRAEEENKPKGQVVSVDNKADWEFVNGAADAGFWVTTVVKNAGVAGDIQVVTFLSCSEGEWSRTQHLYFRAGESMRLRYFFPEPSVLVTNCQARAGVTS